MSIYGDYGNILAINYRLKKYGFNPIYQSVSVGDDLPKNTDFFFMGGGQDKEQLLIFKDLLNKKQRLLEEIEKGVSLLSICGGYQLLGQQFLTGENEIIPGIGLFDVETKAPSTQIAARCVGNLMIESLIPELLEVKLVGFENHSGQTKFTSNKRCHPLGKVLFGFGNNLNKKYEGCVYKNAVGTYMHGSCLPKNPELTDWFIYKSLQAKVKNENLDKAILKKIQAKKLDDTISAVCKLSLVERFLS